jgi:hypothetical protein
MVGEEGLEPSKPLEFLRRASADRSKIDNRQFVVDRDTYCHLGHEMRLIPWINAGTLAGRFFEG